MTKIAVISDIHGNADALAYVLNRVLEEPVDLTVFLGDILTYGAQPLEVISLLQRYQRENHSVFIIGNHDQFYFDIQEGSMFEKYSLPDFVKESILWTASQIQDINFRNLFDWKESYNIADIYFAHANPFNFLNWRYIEQGQDVMEAFEALQAKGFRKGVFGHSHRPKIFYSAEMEKNSSLVNSELYIVNAGSVGQSRGQGFCYLLIDLEKTSDQFKLIPFDFNVDNSISSLKVVDMTDKTKDKLIAYLRS